MKLIKNIFIYYILIIIAIYLLLTLLLPDILEFNSIIELVIVLPLITYYFIPKLLEGKNFVWNDINLGLIYFLSMSVIMIVGNLNNFVVRFVYPKYGDNISITNYYWMGGMITFALGFLVYKNIRLKKNKSRGIKTYSKLSIEIILVVFFISLIGTLYSYLSLGFIPFFRGAGSGLRYTGSVADTTIPLRLWSFNVVSAILGSIYYFKIKKNKIILAVTLFSFLSSFFFIIRIYPFIIIVTIIFIIYVSIQKRNLFLRLLPIFIILFYFFGNYYFVDYRAGGIDNPIIHNRYLNILQKTLYFSFNEYRQLNLAINDYDGDLQYGKTLVGIPIGFIPQQFLAPFGIDKSEIQRNNSAFIIANHLKSKTSIGIRIGLLGEFFINFKYYGLLFMFIVGVIIGVLQKAINTTHITDFRYGFYLLIFSIMLYALIGQGNAVGSLLANYLFFMLLFLLIIRPRKVLNKNEYFSKQRNTI